MSTGTGPNVRESTGAPKPAWAAAASVASLSSLMAVLAPVVALELLRWVSHRPAGDLLIGLPFFTCSALQLAAAITAWRFFSSHKEVRAQPA